MLKVHAQTLPQNPGQNSVQPPSPQKPAPTTRYEIAPGTGEIFDTNTKQDIGIIHKGRLSVDFYKVHDWDQMIQQIKTHMSTPQLQVS